MPGNGRYLMRSRRLWTFSVDRLGFSADSGVIGIPFGLFFSATGLTCVAIIPFVLMQQTTTGIWNRLLFVPVALLIGCGHILGGVMLLWRQRSTLDRKRRTIATRDGWLGLMHRRFSLAPSPSICVSRVKCPWFYYSPLDTVFCISFITKDGEAIAVGYAATDQLATDIENELRCFLPDAITIPTEQLDVAAQTQVATNNPIDRSDRPAAS